MGFWDNVNKELKNAVEEGWSAVKENAKIGKLRLRVHSLHKEADRDFAKIGGIVYEAAKRMENPVNDPEVLKLIDRIKKIESEVDALEQEIIRTKKKEATA